jgi:hypothetical protein
MGLKLLKLLILRIDYDLEDYTTKWASDFVRNLEIHPSQTSIKAGFTGLRMPRGGQNAALNAGPALLGF